jgi:hypothetical protein
MPPVDISVLFDPELILPSEAAANRLEFWQRLQEWVQDRRPRMDPLTSSSFAEIMANPPKLEGLPLGEFWKIAGQLAPRVVNLSTENNPICENHIRGVYKPFYGRTENVEVLLQSLSGRLEDLETALATDAECWESNIPVQGCVECRDGDIALYFAPNDTLAHVWRQRYLKAMPGDLLGIQGLASNMFPQLKFCDSAWTHLGTLEGEPEQLVERLIAHLSVLNDSATTIWEAQSTNVSRESELGSLGINASPENNYTQRRKKARTFEIEGRDVVCMWHTKLQPQIDRIYFSVEDDGVYIGSITGHL